MTMKIISTVSLITLATLAITPTYAIGFDEAKFSILASLAPSLSNQDVDNVANSDQLDDAAYQFQLNYTWKATNAPLFSKAEFEYISVRAFKFIDEYTEEGVTGATELEGIALFYGQRYMMSHDTYEGLGFGWYAGAAIGTDTWIEPGYTTPVEDDMFAPLAAAEVFYKLNLNQQFYVEPSLLVAVDKDVGGITFLPSIIAGIEF